MSRPHPEGPDIRQRNGPADCAPLRPAPGARGPTAPAEGVAGVSAASEAGRELSPARVSVSLVSSLGNSPSERGRTKLSLNF